MQTYGVALTVDNHPYSFHVPTLEAVRELFLGCTSAVQSFRVWEETYTVGEGTTFREMTYREVRQIIEGTLVAA